MKEKEHYQHQISIFYKLKELKLRSEFWKDTMEKLEEYDSLFTIPPTYFLTYEVKQRSLQQVPEELLDRILEIPLEVADPPYSENNLQKLYKLFFSGTPYKKESYRIMLNFINSKEFKRYTLAYIEGFVLRARLYEKVRRIQELEQNERKYRERKVLLEQQINALVGKLRVLLQKKSALKTGIASIWNEQQLLFSPRQLKLFDVPPQKISSELMDYEQTGRLIEKLQSTKNLLEQQYLEIL